MIKVLSNRQQNFEIQKIPLHTFFYCNNQSNKLNMVQVLDREVFYFKYFN